MHNCWNVTEITRMIFDQLGEPKRRSALNGLARTCRTFSEPALDLLWETQQDIIPLLKCFPPHIWTLSDHNFASTLLFPIGAEDWDRVLAYSRRVKRLHISEDAVSLDVMQAIVACLPTDSLTPNVRTLDWYPGPALFHYLRFFIGPHLKSLSLDLEGPVSHLSALQHLASTCPLLTDVTLCDVYPEDVPSEVVIASTSSFVFQLHHLQRLSVDALDESACRYLAKLRGFQSLHIKQLEKRLLPEAPDTQPSFSSLRKLSLTGPRLTPINNFVAALRDSPLTTLRISAYDGVTEGQMQSLSSSVARNCSPPYLKTIRFYFVEKHDPQPPQIITSTALQPLLRFPNLTDVVVTLPKSGSFQLDDAFAAGMAIAWPQLVNLSLGGCDPAAPQSVTIMALFSFARHCPQLLRLCLAFDATRFPEMLPEDASRAPRVIQTACRSLIVLDSPIQSSFQVASLLSSIFPNSRVIASPHGQHKEKWDEVNKMLPMFAALRRDERSFGTGDRGAFSIVTV
ncbi:hypothetical protein C8R43DRAFT_897087 [Mycena crocata]|nr:hypothetical protein C8R43DRAFT_897087 [Mycena crocata]